MVAGSAALMDIPNRELAKQLGVTVVSVDYRKAPEFPWPAGPDDGLAVAALARGARRCRARCRAVADRRRVGGRVPRALVALRVRDELGAIDRVTGLNLTYGIYDWGRTPSRAASARKTASTS